MTHFCFAKINIGTPFTSCFPSCNSVPRLLSDRPPSLLRSPWWGYYRTNHPFPSSSHSACLHPLRAGQPVNFGCLIISLNVWAPRKFIEQEKWDVLQSSSLLQRASYFAFLSGVTIGQSKNEEAETFFNETRIKQPGTSLSGWSFLCRDALKVEGSMDSFPS